jgi:hypothetical protein
VIRVIFFIVDDCSFPDADLFGGKHTSASNIQHTLDWHLIPQNDYPGYFLTELDDDIKDTTEVWGNNNYYKIYLN